MASFCSPPSFCFLRAWNRSVTSGSDMILNTLERVRCTSRMGNPGVSVGWRLCVFGLQRKYGIVRSLSLHMRWYFMQSTNKSSVGVASHNFFSRISNVCIMVRARWCRRLMVLSVEACQVWLALSKWGTMDPLPGLMCTMNCDSCIKQLMLSSWRSVSRTSCCNRSVGTSVVEEDFDCRSGRLSPVFGLFLSLDRWSGLFSPSCCICSWLRSAPHILVAESMSSCPSDAEAID